MNFEAGKKRTITVAQFFKECPTELKLEIPEATNNGEEKLIDSARIQKLGLAVAGYPDYLRSGRIQVLGKSEISYLEQLDQERRSVAIEALPFDLISCIIVTEGLEIPYGLLDAATSGATPVFTTSLETSFVISSITKFLEKKLAERTTIHGVFIGMYELGVLILGESGIGKSECALDLILRGHRLIADDSILITKNGSVLEAESSEITKDYLEIRGLGIINVKDAFGLSAIGSGGKIDLCISLKRWEDSGEIDRLGLELGKEIVFGCDVSSFTLPVSPGRNLSTLIETAVRVYLLKTSGNNAAQELIEKHNAAVSGNF